MELSGRRHHRRFGHGRDLSIRRTAVVEALNAGVDLLLVAYDGAQFYRIFACASDAFGRGKLDPAILHDSEARLKRAFPVD
jgi:beta-N-acetylhexosaminidase